MMAGEASEEKSRNYLASSSGFCYPDVNSNSHFANQMHSFDPNSEIFNLTTGMEMMGFPSKSTQAQQNVSKHGNSPGTSSIKPVSLSSFYQHDDHHHHNQFNRPDFATGFSFSQTNSENLVDDSSLRCVFSCEGRERPSQGLSLSLSSTNPGFQHFELRPISAATTTHHHHDDLRYLTSGSRDGFFGEKPVEIEQNEVVVSEDDYTGKSCNFHLSPSEFHLRNSKFLRAAQELLNDFCCLGTKETGDPPKLKPQREHGNGSGSSSSSRKQQPLYSFDPIELQRRKAKLLSMLEELDRRYRHYCDQMTAVAASFEAVAGNGAAGVYTGMASKAMSRHFRCLRDGIVGQILSIKKAMGEKDPLGGPGTTRGETPRLRVLDQTLRQQKALQQMSMLESHPWRPQRGLPERSVSILRAWLFEHFLHPYPSDVDKHILARQTGLSRSQVSNWFINARVRLWKPMVEEMYLEEIKDQENNNMASSSSEHYQNPNSGAEDEKPTSGRFDPECLSSIISINNPDKNHFIKNPNKTLHQNHQQEAYGGAVELNFPSYHQPMADYTNDGGHQRFGSGGGVSLTLGLQQHAGNGGVSLAFSPACASQSSLFYPRDEIGDCNPVQYSMLADEEGQTRPYRNLLGAQLLHDLAG